jgi:peroxiredoxin
MASILNAGTAAPNFTLRVTPEQYLTLADLKGKNVIIAFYPADWSPVCGDQVTLYNELLPEFHKHDAGTLGNLGRRGLVPRSLCARSQSALPPARRF